MNEYELMYIVHPEADTDAVTAINEQVTGWVGAQGGEVVQTNVWGRRKLAFAIEKQTEGSYVVMNLRLASTSVAEVERNVKLHEQILRYMFVRQGE
ncbi:MAG: 30S ribosomal protein S6 [Anaerolineae bacterium]